MSSSSYSPADMCDLSESDLHDLYVNISLDGDASVNGNLTVSFADFTLNAHALCAQHRFDTVVSWLVPVVFAAIVVLGVVGNSLVLAVVLCGQQMRNTTNVLILVRIVEGGKWMRF